MWECPSESGLWSNRPTQSDRERECKKEAKERRNSTVSVIRQKTGKRQMPFQSKRLQGIKLESESENKTRVTIRDSLLFLG